MTSTAIDLETLLASAFGDRYDAGERSAVGAQVQAFTAQLLLSGAAGKKMQSACEHRRPMVFDITGLTEVEQ